jgi:hypothetical protein
MNFMRQKRTNYGQKVFEMMNGIEVEFGKKKKEEQEKDADGKKKTKKRKRDKMEEEPAALKVPFKKQSCFFRYLSY